MNIRGDLRHLTDRLFHKVLSPGVLTVMLLVIPALPAFACATCGKGAMPTSWDYRLVVLSIFIAIIGSYVALDFAGRMKAALGRPRKLWFTGGALMMGLAIWSMHFVGMLALRMDIPVSYNELLSGLSMAAAAIGAGIAFALMNRSTISRFHLITGSIAMGLAIATMHYTGMASMVMPATTRYHPWIFALSVLIAMVASAGALWIAFRLRRDSPHIWLLQKVGSAVVMGCAIAGMHYTGMAAASYYPLIPLTNSLNSVPTVGLFKLSDILFAASAVFGLALLLLGSQTAAEHQKTAQSLQKSLTRERMVSEIVNNIRSEMDLESILSLATDGLGAFTEADRCVIWLYDNEAKQFRIPRHEYCRSSDIPTINSLSSPETPELPLLARSKTVILREVLQAEGLTDEDRLLIKQRQTKSLLHVPILYQKRLLGLLRIYATRQHREWDGETIAAVEGIAAQAAVALLHSQTLRNLQASETRKLAVLESSLDAVITIDQDGVILEWNPGAERILGYSFPEAKGQDLADLIIPPRYREMHRQGLALYLTTGQGPVLGKLMELPALRKDGTEFPTELWITPVEYEGTFLFTSALRDITDRKLAEEELEKRIVERTAKLQEEIKRRLETEEVLIQSEERSRLIIEAVSDYAIFMLDPTGHVMTWNEGAERINGYTAHEILGKHFSIFYPQEHIEEGFPNQDLETVLQKGGFENEGWRIRKDGSKFWANVTLTSLTDRRGDLLGVSIITRDLSARKTLEEDLLLRSQQLEAVNKELEAFAYSVSHDLRAPLRGIDGFSQAVLEDYGDKLDAEGKHYLSRVREESQRMARLIDDMLTLSRVTRGEIHYGTVDLSTMAKEIATELHEQEPERHVDFNIEDEIIVEGDARLLHAALQNLFSNAWKFTSKHETAHITFGTTQAEDQPVYFVKDDGAGFNMAYSGKMFGAFQRLHRATEFPGTGVGLATVQRIIHRHNGKIWAEGEIEHGATFYFSLN